MREVFAMRVRRGLVFEGSVVADAEDVLGRLVDVCRRVVGVMEKAYEAVELVVHRNYVALGIVVAGIGEALVEVVFFGVVDVDVAAALWWELVI